jgi:hypothetical protein
VAVLEEQQGSGAALSPAQLELLQSRQADVELRRERSKKHNAKWGNTVSRFFARKQLYPDAFQKWLTQGVELYVRIKGISKVCSSSLVTLCDQLVEREELDLLEGFKIVYKEGKVHYLRHAYWEAWKEVLEKPPKLDRWWPIQSFNMQAALADPIRNRDGKIADKELIDRTIAMLNDRDYEAAVPTVMAAVPTVMAVPTVASARKDVEVIDLLSDSSDSDNERLNSEIPHRLGQRATQATAKKMAEVIDLLSDSSVSENE